MAQLTPEVALKKAEQAFNVKRLWRDLLGDAYEYFLPQRNLYHDDGDGVHVSTPGQKKVDRWPSVSRRTGWPQETQGSPARP